MRISDWSSDVCSSIYFFDLCQEAQKRPADEPLKHGDWRFSFLAWWEHPEYRIDAQRFVFTENELKYLADIEGKIGRKLERDQRVWYCQKWTDPGDNVK